MQNKLKLLQRRDFRVLHVTSRQQITKGMLKEGETLFSFFDTGLTDIIGKK